MRDARVAKRAYDVDECVGVLIARDIDECLRTAASGRNDVGEFHCRRHSLARVVHRRQRIEAGIGHLRDADVDVTFSLAVRLERWSSTETGWSYRSTGSRSEPREA